MSTREFGVRMLTRGEAQVQAGARLLLTLAPALWLSLCSQFVLVLPPGLVVRVSFLRA